MSKSRKIEITIETHEITRTHHHRPATVVVADMSEPGDAQTAVAEFERGHLMRAGLAEKVEDMNE
ncbi:MAG TPA: hypothetical protein VK918_06565 [Pyrinomonadaceae bacterium]|nr:hypothetical protein [Pyrinomonadaceae bacterium]